MSTNRRQFLRGVAGFTLAIPFLPSLLPRDARASEAEPKRFIAIGTEHGGVWQPYVYPDSATLIDAQVYGGHTIRRGPLVRHTSGGRAWLSPMLSGPASQLTDSVVRQMNVMRGLDVPFYLAHHRGGHLGNYAENDGNGSDSSSIQADRRPTIDQILAWSPAFYGDLSTIIDRSLVLGGNGMSAGWSNPTQASGNVDNIPPEFDSRAIFDRYFSTDAPTTRAPVVDLVLADFRRLRQSDPRIGAEDRRRLDEHMERLLELERRLSIQSACQDLPAPAGSSRTVQQEPSFGIAPLRQIASYQLMNDVLVAALACDATRIVTLRANHTFSDYDGDWHQDIAHQAHNTQWASPPSQQGSPPQDTIAEAHQRFFEGVFLDLVAKLDGTPTISGTLLEACLVQWTHESGPVTHDPIEMPVITAGGASGELETGYYADYRDLNVPAHRLGPTLAVASHTGLIYNQWLGTVLQIMGLQPSTYERDGRGGYGLLLQSTEGWYAGYNKYPSDVFSVMGESLPWVT